MPSVYKGIANNTDEWWFRDPCLRKNMFYIGSLILANVIGGYDGSLLNGFQALPQFRQSFPQLFSNSNLLGITGASLFLPGLIMVPLGAALADKYGRKWILMANPVFICTGAIMQATTTNNLGIFIASRVLIGLNYLSSPATVAMLAEISHPRFRAVVTAITLCSFYVGSIMSSWLCFGMLQHLPNSSWSWRLPSIMQALLPAACILPYILIPESPRWLIYNGKLEQARRILANQHANGDINDPLVQFQVDEILAAKHAEERLPKSSWKALFATKPNRKRAFICIVIGAGQQLNGVGVMSYYLVPVLATVGITDPTQQTLITGGMSISNFVCSLVGASLIEKAGRRPLWLTSTTGMLICYVFITALSATFAKDGGRGTGQGVIAFLYLFYACYCLAWTPLTTAYVVEILPYSIRAKGLALWTTTTLLSLCINTWVNPIALAAIAWKYYIVYIGILCFLLAYAFFFFPETKGLTLEEVAIRFDGENALELKHHPDAVQDVEAVPSEDGLDKKEDVQHVDRALPAR